uniref:Uncharacterized protein n=1 Tax=Graphocephala atropunctata TaxID=36148 RepID=A0A1B6L114_9HEMI
MQELTVLHMENKNHYAVGCQSANRSKPQPQRTVHEAKLGLEDSEDIFIGMLFQEDVTKQINNREEAQPIADVFEQLVQQVNYAEKKTTALSWMQQVKINNQSVNFKLDSGAQCNVLSIMC